MRVCNRNVFSAGSHLSTPMKKRIMEGGDLLDIFPVSGASYKSHDDVRNDRPRFNYFSLYLFLISSNWQV
jgi:hypothetical protein